MQDENPKTSSYQTWFFVGCLKCAKVWRERNPTNDFECFGVFEKLNVLEHLKKKNFFWSIWRKKTNCFGAFEKQNVLEHLKNKKFWSIYREKKNVLEFLKNKKSAAKYCCWSLPPFTALFGLMRMDCDEKKWRHTY